MYETKDVPVTAENDNLATRLRTARDAKKLTRKQVAEETGIPEKSIEKFENGSQDPTVPRLISLAGLYDIPASVLMGEEPISHSFDTDRNEDKGNAPRELMENDQTDEGATPAVNVNDIDAPIVSPTSVPETVESILSDLNQMREVGFVDGKNAALELIGKVRQMTSVMEPVELDDLASKVGLFCEEPDDGFGLLSLVDDDPTGADLIFKGNIADRMIDTSLLGTDLYGIDEDDLIHIGTELAEQELIDEPFFWGDHEKFVPILRPHFWKMAMMGKGYDFADREKFSLRESEEN